MENELKRNNFITSEELEPIVKKVKMLEDISSKMIKLTCDSLEVKIKRLHPSAVIPEYAKPDDMGMDLTAVDYEYDAKRDCYVYHTGLAFEVPEGYGMLIFPRSSNRNTDCYMTNHVGVLDSGYRGELLVCFKRRDKIEDPNLVNAPYGCWERVAQLIIFPYPKVNFVEVKELSETERGIGGHGSTGK